jgi:PilZ domain-containing protein
MNSMAERRSDVRMMCADLVEISWQDRVGSRHTAQAVLEDIAASGACLQVEVPIPLGSVVHWRSPKKAFSGAVRYCEYREIGYFVGVRFDASSTWSRDEYRPQHLLDLAKLVPRTR